MATRSTIAYQNSEGNVEIIYCHWDGYPSHNGRILLEHYNTIEKVQELISLGNLSSLGELCDCPPGHTFDNPAPNRTVAYGRDRGEYDGKARTYASHDQAMRRGEAEEYDYFFVDGKWYCNGYELNDVEEDEDD